MFAFAGAFFRYLRVVPDVLAFSKTCASPTRLDGKTVVVTGGSTGIGKCTAKDLFCRGARVIITATTLEKAQKAVAEIKKECESIPNSGGILGMELELNKLESVRNCAKHLTDNEKKIDLLINNAGVMMCPKGRTEDGFETQMGINHLGHFLFTLLLLPRILQNGQARIVNVSSLAHWGARIDLDDLNWERKKYNSLDSYQQSKLANILFAKELARKLKGCVNTGLLNDLEAMFGVFSWFFRHVVRRLLKTPQRGAQTTIYCAVSEECAHQTGWYYTNCAEKSPSQVALNEEDAKGLWDLSWKLVGLDDQYDPFAKLKE